MQKIAVLYYSYTGSTRKLAQDLARALTESGREVELFEVKDQKRPAAIKAYTAGCFNARRMHPAKVQPIGANLAVCDAIVLLAPIWWGHPAPPFNNMVAALPQGKKVEVWAVSASGTSAAKEKVAAGVEKQGCTLGRYRDVKPSFALENLGVDLEQ